MSCDAEKDLIVTEHIQRVEIGNATLHLANAYELVPHLGFFDVLIADPQYDFKTEGGGSYRKSRNGLDDIIEQGLDKGFDHSIINPLLHRSVMVFCHNDQLPELLSYMKGSYWRFALCDWKKTNPQPVCNKNYLPDKEYYIHAWHEGCHPLGGYKDLSRNITVPNGGKSKFGHPTVKPDTVMNKIMTNANGHKILDPFMGTGSTGVAAIRAGKHFVGVEHNVRHFDTAVRRISDAVAEVGA